MPFLWVKTDSFYYYYFVFEVGPNINVSRLMQYIASLETGWVLRMVFGNRHERETTNISILDKFRRLRFII